MELRLMSLWWCLQPTNENVLQSKPLDEIPDEDYLINIFIFFTLKFDN